MIHPESPVPWVITESQTPENTQPEPSHWPSVCLSEEMGMLFNPHFLQYKIAVANSLLKANHAMWLAMNLLHRNVEADIETTLLPQVGLTLQIAENCMGLARGNEASSLAIDALTEEMYETFYQTGALPGIHHPVAISSFREFEGYMLSLLTVSHDSKSILTSIKGYVQLMQRYLLRGEIERADALRKNLRQIMEGATTFFQSMQDTLQGNNTDSIMGPYTIETCMDIAFAPVSREATDGEGGARTWTLAKFRIDGTISGRAICIPASFLPRYTHNVTSNAQRFTPLGSPTVLDTIVQLEKDGEQEYLIMRIRDYGKGFGGKVGERKDFELGETEGGNGIGMAGLKIKLQEKYPDADMYLIQEEKGVTNVLKIPLLDASVMAR